MALIGNIIAMSDHGNPASTVNYNLFVSAFTLLTLLWLIPAAIWESIAGHPAIIFLIDLLNTIFTFCGAIALASKLHAPNCNDDVRPFIIFLSFCLVLSCPAFAASSQPINTSSRHGTVRNPPKHHNPQFELPRKILPRGPGCRRVPVVPVVCVLDIDHRLREAGSQGHPGPSDHWQAAVPGRPSPDVSGLE